MIEMVEQGGSVGQAVTGEGENKEIKDLQDANTKLNYRIKHLLRALDEAEQNQDQSEPKEEQKQKQSEPKEEQKQKQNEPKEEQKQE